MAIQSGAWNYLEKPFFRQEITLQVTRALEFRKEKGRVSGIGGLNRSRIIGESEVIRSCLEQVRVAAYSDLPVLISGESGVGKQLFAKTIHLNSEYGNHNFVIADCSAMAEGVADRLFYGSMDEVKGGKEKGRPGFFDLADKGTLFLCDISRLPLAVEKSIHRAMEGRRFVPKGGKDSKSTHLRIIASTRQSIDPALYSVHLPSHIRSFAIKKPGENAKPLAGPDMFKDGFLPLKTFTQQWELYYLKHLFEHVAYDVQKVCEISGISKSSIYSRLRRYKIN